MTLISIKKTAVVEPAPTGTVSLYVDSADSHLKQVDEAGAIIDLTDGSVTSSPNMAQLINITLETLVVDVVNEGLINPKATYRITDAAQGVIRVFGKIATELTATAMLEGTDDGTGSITAGQWGNYDLDGDVFTPTDAIPLSGTTTGNNVTGDIVTDAGRRIKTLSSDEVSFNSFYLDDGGVQMQADNGTDTGVASLSTAGLDVSSTDRPVSITDNSRTVSSLSAVDPTTEAPEAAGLLNVQGSTIYISVGSASSSDWKQIFPAL